MTLTLPPLTPGPVRDYHASGKYPLYLYIFPESTIQHSDIERILELASWNVNPNTHAEGFEGGRSVLLSREKPSLDNGITYNALQLSGIGYRKLKVSRTGNGSVKEPTFYPPSTKNFMEGLPPGAGGYTYPQGDKLIACCLSYTPLGTYRSDELFRKIQNTRAMSRLQHPAIPVPPVEAYGQYNHPELFHAGKPLGFLVLAHPHVATTRLQALLAQEARQVDFKSEPERFISRGKELLLLLTKVLRELHTMGKVHLQPHFSNWYILNNTAVLTDWETLMTPNTPEEKILGQSLDLGIVVREYTNYFKQLFTGYPSEVHDLFKQFVAQQAIEAYAQHAGCAIPQLPDTSSFQDQQGRFQEFEFFKRSMNIIEQG